MSKASALTNALRSAGARVQAPASVSPPAPVTAPVAETVAPAVITAPQSSRVGTKPITVHYPEEVRRQLKAMAAEQGRTVEDVVAEALNLVFAAHRKPEIAPRKGK